MKEGYRPVFNAFSEHALGHSTKLQLGFISVISVTTTHFLPSTTMDPPGSNLTVSQLLFALKGELDRLQAMEASDAK